MKPKTSKKKIEKIKRKKYTKECVEKALQAIRNGMSKKLASKTYQVPRSTLQFKTKFPDRKSRPGPSTVLFENEEIILKNWLVESSKKGFPKRKEDLLASVAQFLKKSKRPNPFRNGVPGEKWYKLFLRRHSDISIRTPEAVTSASAAVAEEDIKGWFNNIHKYLEDNNLLDILSDGKRIYNGDETNFLLCPKSGVVLSAKGEKNVYEIDHAPAKTSLTVLFTFGADGSITPPLVIFPYKRMPSEISSKVPSDWGIGISDNGWMKADIFFDYIKNVFHPHLIKTKTKFPVILYVDGHKTHLTYETSELCTDLNIILIALYPNCTRIIQPADVAAFKPMKAGWQKTVLAWRRDNPSKALTKQDFVPLLKKTIDETMNPVTVINGFRATGLYPFNKDAIDYTKCLGKKKTNTEPSMESEIIGANHLNETETKQIKMTLEDFKRIVGANKLQLIKANNTEIDEDLRRMYTYFMKGQDTKQQGPEEPLTGKSSLQHSLDDQIEVSIVDLQNKIFMEDKTTLPHQSSEHAANKEGANQENLNIENMEVIFADDCENSVIIDSQAAEPNFELICERALIHNNDVTQDRSNNRNIAIPHTSKVHSDLDKIEILSIEEPSRQQLVNLKSVKVTPVKLNDILILPKTPQRKGARNITRAPFVLTSREWQDQEMQKRREKEEKAEMIKNRKEERERKKTEKPIKIKKENIIKRKKLLPKNIKIGHAELLQPQNTNVLVDIGLKIPTLSAKIVQEIDTKDDDDTDIETYYEAMSLEENKKPQKKYSLSELEKVLSEMED